jgi:type IV pilus biogenesis protein CpaD/CtpE
MKSLPLSVLAMAALAACTDPVVDQAAIEAHQIPSRADRMLAFDFAPGNTRLDMSQEQQIRELVAGRHGDRDEFVVVTDGSGGPMQQSRAAHLASRLSQAGAHWVSASIESAMTRGPDQILVVRSEYLIGMRNCPSYTPATIWKPNESLAPNYGCANAYNMGQMLARPRDAAVGRSPGPADGAVNAEAVQRYREGRVRAASAVNTGGSGGGAAAAPPGAGSPPP